MSPRPKKEKKSYPKKAPDAPGNCRSCGAPIYWARMNDVAGRWNPIDIIPSSKGNLVLSVHNNEFLIATPHTPAIPADRRRFVSHFVTCPEAGKFRKGTQ